jgi:hypothetical protein
MYSYTKLCTQFQEGGYSLSGLRLNFVIGSDSNGDILYLLKYNFEDNGKTLILMHPY